MVLFLFACWGMYVHIASVTASLPLCLHASVCELVQWLAKIFGIPMHGRKKPWIVYMYFNEFSINI